MAKILGLDPDRGFEVVARASVCTALVQSLDWIGNCQCLCRFLIGGASRDRTDDLIVANDALSQLSYSPTTADH